ncbi:hypothetical protein IQ22_00962 [Pseudomonas duriflava]|uniref:Uncharacterized protein n=1 Tax=Pseudomonas duriflava TaxID=459528 RepID=A0A562QID2_9PSED|nr:hypothetical protein [Pseudomonas duriflava]TWI56512.1 hypothetical protein IQ22_00962 [Pseudomonas duriflava]
MMHADLIDQDDFRDRLQALGIPVPSGVSPEQACQQALCGLNKEQALALRRLVEELLSGSATLLPSVREAIARQLLPALAQQH